MFLHHDNNDVTKHNFNLLKHYNPDSTVIPVGFIWHKLLEKSHVVYRKNIFPNNDILNMVLSNGKSTSSESDLCIYDCFLNHNGFKHYFVIEWDTYCNCSILDFYGDILPSYDTFSGLIFTNIADAPDATRKMNVKEWSWYNYFTGIKSKEEQEQLLPHLGGTYPTSLLYYTNQALADITYSLIAKPTLFNNIQNEMRLGTLLQKAGYVLKEFGSDKNHFFEQDHYKANIASNIKGYYHPVKYIV